MTKKELETKYYNLEINHQKLQEQTKTLISERDEANKSFDKFYDRALRAEGLIKDNLKPELDRLNRELVRNKVRVEALLYALNLAHAHNYDLQTKLKEFFHPFNPDESLKPDTFEVGS